MNGGWPFLMEFTTISWNLLAGRLREEEKKKVVDMTKSLALPRNILMDLKE